jgi:hypothetical protein
MKTRSRLVESGEKLICSAGAGSRFLRDDFLDIPGALRAYPLIATADTLFFSESARTQTINYWETSGGGVCSTGAPRWGRMQLSFWLPIPL